MKAHILFASSKINTAFMLGIGTIQDLKGIDVMHHFFLWNTSYIYLVHLNFVWSNNTFDFVRPMSDTDFKILISLYWIFLFLHFRG
jgi:hypothetical protein